MLITKFNALIRNRFIWGFFAVLVSITMVGFFTNVEGCGTDARHPGSVGELNGEPVTWRELQDAKFNVVLRLRLSTGRDFNLTPEMDVMVTHEAWKRLALLRLATQEKLVALDGEVAAAIQRDPMFQNNGVFEKARVEQFMQVLAQNYGFAPGQFEEYLREELTLDKVRRTLSAAVWTAPFEINRLARNFAESFTVSYIDTPRSALTRDVTVTEAQIKAYYDTHAEDFTIPDMAQAAYVAFPYSNYTTSADVPAEAVTNYYAEHMNDYFTTNAAGEPEARKIEEVADSIRQALATEAQQEKAFEDAARFADSLYNLSGKTNFFRIAAAAEKRTVKLTRFFAERESLRELGVGPDFNSAAFALRPEKNADFSDTPIAGSNAVYVLSYEDFKPTRLPPFEEVRDMASNRALAEARNRHLQEKSSALSKQVQEAVRTGGPFDAAVKAIGLTGTVKTAGPFTAYTAPEPFDSARLITAIISLQEGEVSELVETEKNSVFLIMCTKRELGDATSADPVRNQIRGSLNRRHAQLLISQWEEDLLKKMGYKEPVADEQDAGGDEDRRDQMPMGPGQL